MGGGEGAMPRNSTGYDLKSTEDSTLLKEETGQRRVGRRQPACGMVQAAKPGHTEQAISSVNVRFFFCKMAMVTHGWA